MASNSPILENPLKLICYCCGRLLAIVQRQSLVAELQQERAVLHRLASHRADHTTPT